MSDSTGGTLAQADPRASAATAAVAASVLVTLASMMAWALWNGYPLLQYDTGGYLARWYEGYLVPSRSTVYGVFLHLGETMRFWPNVVAQAAATLYVLFLTLRELGIVRPLLWCACVLALCLTTALPFLSSLLLTDIFAGLGVLAVFLLAGASFSLSTAERASLFGITAFAAATHSATFGLLGGLCLSGWIARFWLGPHLARRGLAIASAGVIAGAALLLTTNFMLSGQMKWTPGGYGILFGRLLENGTVKPYLETTCRRVNYRLCAHRAELPATADEFLWGHSVFDRLGRFAGLGDEMRAIVIGAAAATPATQVVEAVRAAARQLTLVSTGEGSHNQLAHTYGIIERYIPHQLAPLRAARQQHGELRFAMANAVHVPVAFASMVLLLLVLMHDAWRRHADAITLLAGTVVLALLGNAVLCGALSGPHPRYGARIVWLATFAVLAALFRATVPYGRRARNAMTPAL